MAQRNIHQKQTIQDMARKQDYLVGFLLRLFGPHTPESQQVSSWTPTETPERIRISEIPTVLHPVTPPRIEAAPIAEKVVATDSPEFRNTLLKYQVRDRARRNQEELVARLQQLISQYYFTHNNCWPGTVEVSATQMLLLSGKLTDDDCFPDTPVLIVGVKGCHEPACKPLYREEPFVQDIPPTQEEDSAT